MCDNQLAPAHVPFIMLHHLWHLLLLYPALYIGEGHKGNITLRTSSRFY